MKIAFIVNVFPKLSETFILYQITGLIDLGHEVDIFAKTNPCEANVHREVEEYQLMARTYYFNEPRKRCTRLLRTALLLLRNFHKGPGEIIRSLMMAKRFGLSRRASWHYVLPCLGKNYDIIYCHFGPNGNIGALLKASGVKGKILVSFHGYDMAHSLVEEGTFYKGLFQVGDLFMADSNDFRNKLVKMGCPEEKVIIHRMGVPVNRLKFEERRFEHGSPLKLMTFCRLTEKKGHEYALQALANILPKHPNLSYRIGGAGHLSAALKSLVQRLGIESHVTFLGELSDAEVEVLRRDSDLFIHPSVTATDGDTEGCPLAIQEAQACGMPVLSTFHGGIPDLVINGVSGFLVPERDVDALTERLDYLIQHPELWPDMGRAGRQFVEEHFDITKLNQRLVEIYQGLIEGRSVK